ncbi:MAG: AAA family ATPase [Bacteroidales bacterium]|nr:AAA family ATPase [Bacteroidales bacterium]
MFSLRELREKGCLYVDKTHFIPKLTWTSDFISLYRPNEFAKV